MLIQGKPRIGNLSGVPHTKPTTNEDVDNGFINGVAGKSKRTESGFDSFAPHAPQNVKNAWKKAADDTGVNGLGIGDNGMMTHIPAALIVQLEQRQGSGSSDVFGNSVASARDAATKILMKLENPVTPETNSKIRSYQEQEKQFYNAFIANLSEYGDDAATAFRGFRL